MGLSIARCTVVLSSLALATAPVAAETMGSAVDPPAGGAQAPAAQGLRIVYLNFEGVELTSSVSDDDARTDVSFIISAATSPGATLTILPFDEGDLSDTFGLTRSAIIAGVVADLYTMHDPYNIEFVTSRPVSGNYQMIVFGSDCATVKADTCAGVAVMDCSDSMASNIGFAFPPGLDPDKLTVVAAQEMAHAFGLNHTEDTSDIMFPTMQAPLPTSYGAGAIPMTETGCGGAIFQDSHALLMATVGYRGQDTTAPQVTITAPADGVLLDGPTVVSADITDDVEVARAEFVVNGALEAELTSPPWEITLQEPPRGQHTVTVRAFDPSDNEASAMITVYTGDCVEDGDCQPGFECSEQLCVMSGEMNPDGAALGEPCANDGECASGLCETVREESLCSQSCSTDSDCPFGFECKAGEACWPTEGGGGGGGGADDEGDDGPFACLSSVAPRSGGGMSLLLLSAAVLLLGLRRRRGEGTRR